MAGSEDQVVDVERQAIRLHKEITHSRLQLVPTAGHMLHYSPVANVVEAVNLAAGRGTDQVRTASRISL
jgi:pimeloyl-ACP methyl ester carboxylesterase